MGTFMIMDRKKIAQVELIPEEHWSPEQKAFQTVNGSIIPLYKWIKRPRDVGHFDWEEYDKIAIWYDNGTILFTHFTCSWATTNNEDESDPVIHFPNTHSLSIEMNNVDMKAIKCSIYGKTDTAIAETATEFWSLAHAKHRDDKSSRLKIGNDDDNNDERSFDFTVLQPAQLTRILDSNPLRRLHLSKTVQLSTEQSVLFATRTAPLFLELGEAFPDGGTAFLDALETRHTPLLGELYFRLVDEVFADALSPRRYRPYPWSRSNLSRLRQFDQNMVDKLIVNCESEECALVPLSVKAKSLDLTIDVKLLKQVDFVSLDIWTAELNLTFRDRNSCRGPMIWLLDRIAQLGHLEKLVLFMDSWEKVDFDQVVPMAEALIRAIRGNPNLSHLDLSQTDWEHLDWAPHFETIFQAMEDHTGLRTFIVQDDRAPTRCHVPPRRRSADYSWLSRLISRNRNIVVKGGRGYRCCAGTMIEVLYTLNSCYNGSAKLVKEPFSWRSQLVATALQQRPLRRFRCTALMLSLHTDVLCAFIEDRNNDEDEFVSQS